MGWTRLGHVFVPDGSRPWARSHAALPTPLHLHDDIFRFFFSSRDADKRSHIGWVDVEITDRPRVVAMADEPVLSPGEDGAFDDSGVSIGCVIPLEGRLRVYYMGWNLGTRSPWRNAIGIAEAATADGPFVRYSPGPILDRSPEDPYTLTYPWVVEAGPQNWSMWYGSNLTASIANDKMRHVIKHAKSRDGVRWTRDGATVVGFREADDYVSLRPSVIQNGSSLLLCFACRGEHYRIVAAQSVDDGETWTWLDRSAGLQRSGTGWDSDMVCYPALFRHRQRLWMAYNGNGFGATGFGLAGWDGEVA